MVGVPGVAGGEQKTPAPLEGGDRGARLVVRAVGGQLKAVTERLVAVPGAVAAGQVGFRCGHVGPAALRGAEQFRVAGLDGHVRDARLQVQGADGMADLGGLLADRQVVLQVAVAEARVAGQPVASLVDELAPRSR